MARYEISHDRLRGAAEIALSILGFDGMAEILVEHCPPGAPVTVRTVTDRAACLRAMREAVASTA